MTCLGGTSALRLDSDFARGPRQHEGLGGRALIDAAKAQNEQVTLAAAEGDVDGRAAFDRRSGRIQAHAIAVHAQRAALAGEREAVERDGRNVLDVADRAAKMAATGFDWASPNQQPEMIPVERLSTDQ